jgi:threonine dehydratase
VISQESILNAARTIEGRVRRTPVVECDGVDFGLPPIRLTFKLELLQHTGSFKARGAMFNVLSRPIPEAGVAAASGGNHGVAVAWAAQRAGVAGSIFVPTVCSQAKIDRIRGFGARLTISGERYADSLAACDRWVAENGALSIHAFDQVETLTGQGTLGLEFEEQAPGLDTLLIAVGGGGLIGGVAAWYRGRVKIVAVEPEQCPTLFMAMEAGRPVDAPSGGVAADSLAPLRVGEMMFPLAQAWVERTVLVPDSAIQESQKKLWEVLRVASEPGGATAMAALLSGAYKPAPGEKVGVLVCGGNTTAVQF